MEGIRLSYHTAKPRKNANSLDGGYPPSRCLPDIQLGQTCQARSCDVVRIIVPDRKIKGGET